MVFDFRGANRAMRSSSMAAILTDMRAAEIVGGGFAGLAAACALAQRGWRVRLHERASELRTAGAGINVYENGLRVLEALGAVEDTIRDGSFVDRSGLMTDQLCPPLEVLNITWQP